MFISHNSQDLYKFENGNFFISLVLSMQYGTVVISVKDPYRINHDYIKICMFKSQKFTCLLSIYVILHFGSWPCFYLWVTGYHYSDTTFLKSLNCF
jgi:hypothetical protein